MFETDTESSSDSTLIDTYPDADTNDDGTVTDAELAAYQAAQAADASADANADAAAEIASAAASYTQARTTLSALD
ncbi:hypothetical protein Q4543_00140 [Salipiger sp. 1_MG-2023]|uniref:hypothetical protein n=1 Tax=Salipiger sp. 1_MG-2023 TaxID=3062665 RepID=UPI0026E1D209|nr:hypothetical protein [Salipiger sp. 1_MG-2023]MDO6583918.1 hypothetical protein [Salipiger sp. 1_MG-2023]